VFISLPACLFLSIGSFGCGTDATSPFVQMCSTSITIVNQDGDPLIGATVWILPLSFDPFTRTTSGDFGADFSSEPLGLVDQGGFSCADPTSEFISAGCTDLVGVVVLFCDRGASHEVEVLFQGNTTSFSIDCDGEPVEEELEIPEEE
jgi:hypothetical protein